MLIMKSMLNHSIVCFYHGDTINIATQCILSGIERERYKVKWAITTAESVELSVKNHPIYIGGGMDKKCKSSP